MQLVFISPESIINNPVYRNMLISHEYKKRLVALAIDEVHCVKTWGMISGWLLLRSVKLDPRWCQYHCTDSNSNVRNI